MLGKWLKRLEAPDHEPHPKREVATAMLLLECARADFEQKPAEIEEVRRMLGTDLGLSNDEIDEVLRDARRTSRKAVSLYGPVSRLNDELSPEDKLRLMSWLWRVALADGHIDAREEHLLRKLADLLHITHADFVRTRLAVQQGP